jgi:hypothetical protein
LVFGAGLSVGVGTWETGSGSRRGVYLRVALAVGFDVAAGIEGGVADSEAALQGSAGGGCAGVFTVSYCESQSRAGSTRGGQFTIGPSEALPVSGSAEQSFTFTAGVNAAPAGSASSAPTVSQAPDATAARGRPPKPRPAVPLGQVPTVGPPPDERTIGPRP